MYTVHLAGVVYMLHVFQKKATHGIASSWHHSQLAAGRPPEEDKHDHSEVSARRRPSERMHFEESSGNVLDLGLPNPEERLAKAHLYDPLNRTRQTVQYTAKQVNPVVANPLAGCDATQLSCADTIPSAFVPALAATLVTSYGYSPMDLDTVIDPRSVRRTYRHDARGLQWQETDEFSLSGTATYDGAGLATATLARSGVEVRHHYDAVGRRTSTVYPQTDYSAGCQPSPACVTALQVPGDSITYAYDVLGNLLVAQKSAEHAHPQLLRGRLRQGSDRSVERRHPRHAVVRIRCNAGHHPRDPRMGRPRHHHLPVQHGQRRPSSTAPIERTSSTKRMASISTRIAARSRGSGSIAEGEQLPARSNQE